MRATSRGSDAWGIFARRSKISSPAVFLGAGTRLRGSESLAISLEKFYTLTLGLLENLPELLERPLEDAASFRKLPSKIIIRYADVGEKFARGLKLTTLKFSSDIISIAGGFRRNLMIIQKVRAFPLHAPAGI